MNEIRKCGVLTDANMERIRRHYRHAVEKHPYFADSVINGLPTKAREEVLKSMRGMLSALADDGMASAEAVLDCELAEAYVEIARGHHAAAVSECCDAIAVLLRMVDVLEGRQLLGKEGGAE